MTVIEAVEKKTRPAVLRRQSLRPRFLSELEVQSGVKTKAAASRW